MTCCGGVASNDLEVKFNRIKQCKKSKSLLNFIQMYKIQFDTNACPQTETLKLKVKETRPVLQYSTFPLSNIKTRKAIFANLIFCLK